MSWAGDMWRALAAKTDEQRAPDLVAEALAHAATADAAWLDMLIQRVERHYPEETHALPAQM